MRGEVIPGKRSIAYYLRRGKFLHAFLSLNRGERLPRPFVLRGHHFHTLDRFQTPSGEAPDGHWFRPATAGDLPIWSGLHRSRELFDRRLDQGDVCVIGGAGQGESSRVVTVRWFTHRPFCVWDQRVVIDCGEVGWYVFDGFTKPEFREKGLARWLQHAFVEKHRPQWVGNCTDILNERALEAWKRIGWKRFGTLIVIGFAGFKVFRWRLLEDETDTEPKEKSPRSRWFFCSPGTMLYLDVARRMIRKLETDPGAGPLDHRPQEAQ